MRGRFNLQHVGDDKEEVRWGKVISFAWLPPLAASGVGAGTSSPCNQITSLVSKHWIARIDIRWVRVAERLSVCSNPSMLSTHACRWEHVYLPYDHQTAILQPDFCGNLLVLHSYSTACHESPIKTLTKSITIIFTHVWIKHTFYQNLAGLLISLPVVGFLGSRE